MSMGRIISIFGIALVSGLILFKGITSQNGLSGGESVKQVETLDVSWNLSDFPGAKSQNELKYILETKLPGLKVSEVGLSPIKGYYQVFYDSDLLYVSVDGRFLFTGTMIEISGERPVNHSQIALFEADKRRAPQRAALISGVDESDMVVFKAKEQKHVITVFTDVDCAYCRKLHKEVPELNAKGVTVRYMAYPRAGIGSDAYRKLVSIWCSEDKLNAMDEAKLKRKFSNNSCKNPIAAHYNMVRNLHLSGTPAVITEAGEVIGGYLPAGEMYGMLRTSEMAKEMEAAEGSGR